MRNYMLILFLYPVLVFGQGDSITVKVPMGLPTGIAPMGTRFMLLSEPSAIRYLKINASNDVVLRTAAEMLSDIGAQAAGSYQPLATNLTTIGGLANGNGFLKNNGSGTFSYETPAGSGDLLAANNLSDLANSATARTNIGLSTTANLTNSTNKNFVTDAQSTVIGNTSGTNTGDQTTVSGNAGTATALQNARTINGTSFNGTANITLGTASVTLAQMADMATASLIYRRTAGTGVPEINTLAQLKTDLTLVKADVGLGNVDNTSNATERAASAVLSTKTIATFNYAADAGSNDTYVISLSPAATSYTTGMVIFFKANTVNTGAASINVNSLGVKTIVKRVSTALANGDIPALALCMLLYDGTNFVLLNPVVN